MGDFACEADNGIRKLDFDGWLEAEFRGRRLAPTPDFLRKVISARRWTSRRWRKGW